MAIRPKYSQSDVKRFFEAYYREVEAKLIEMLEYVGEGFVGEARSMTKLEGGFGDVTGNLRSSIGYFIVKDGAIIKENVELSEKGTDKHSGLSKAKAFIQQIKESGGLRIYGVAGMEYAEEVESKGLNVITVQADMLIIELKDILNRMK